MFSQENQGFKLSSFLNITAINLSSFFSFFCKGSFCSGKGEVISSPQIAAIIRFSLSLPLVLFSTLESFLLTWTYILPSFDWRYGHRLRASASGCFSYCSVTNRFCLFNKSLLMRKKKKKKKTCLSSMWCTDLHKSLQLLWNDELL